MSVADKAYSRINLMLIMDEEKWHYCWINNLGRLLFSKTKHNTGGRQFHCDFCLSHFTYEKVLEKHQEVCEGVTGRLTRIEMPEKGSTLKFENYQKQQKAPYVIYADFKSIIEKVGENRENGKTACHDASGYAYTVVRSDGKSWRKKYRKGKDGEPHAVQEFLKSIVEEEEKIREELKSHAPLKMGGEDWEKFNKAVDCWIREKPLWVDNFLNSVPVRDPPTGKYCGQSQRKCRWDGACKAFGQRNGFGRLEKFQKPLSIAKLQKRDKIDD